MLDDNGDFVGFDVVIGNPPYMAVNKKSKEGEYYIKEYVLQQGKYDLYRLFVEKAHEVLKKNGVFCFIIPNSILSIPACNSLREYLLNQISLDIIISFYGHVFEEAEINNVILFTQKSQPKPEIIVVEDYTQAPSEHSLKLALSKKKMVGKVNWINFKKYGFKTNLTNDDYIVLQSILKNSYELKNVARYTLGLQVYHNTLHSKEDIKNRIFHNDKPLNSTYYPEAGGRHIKKFGLNQDISNFVSYGDWCYNKPPLEFCIGTRIFIREICSPKGLIASLVTNTLVPNKSIIALIPNSNPYIFLGILNSKVIGYFVEKTTEKGNQRLFPRVSLNTIAKIPISNADLNNYPRLTQLVKEVINIKNTKPESDTLGIETEIDQLVYRLYDLSKEEIQIIENTIK